MSAPDAGIFLWWLPLGAGGHFVRLNGRIYELIRSRREHRPPLELYHTALEVVVPEGRYVIENAWPIPDDHPDDRGVTVQGPVGLAALGRTRVFRYEVRVWRDGVIADAGYAVDGPVLVNDAPSSAAEILELAAEVPVHVWGRDSLGLGEMWNSNSVISWLLTSVGIDALHIPPPTGGRAPGWLAGVLVAQRSMETYPKTRQRS